MAAQFDEWLTIAEACRYLKVTRATVYRWAHEGRLRLYKMGGRTTRVRLNDLQCLATVAEDKDWQTLSLGVFAKDWDNEKDAVYDGWREIYGIPKG